MSLVPVITISKQGETGKSWPIDGEVLLGRSDDCAIQLDDRAISRQHALFKVSGTQLQVESRSVFGALKVNGVECTRAVLVNGDVLEMGPYQARIELGPSGRTSAQEQAEAPPKRSAKSASQDSSRDLMSDFESASENNVDPQKSEHSKGEVALGIPLDFEAEASKEEVKSSSDSEFESSPESSSESSQESGEELDSGGENAEPSESADSEHPGFNLADSIEDSDGRTRVGVLDLSVQLVFIPGTANYTEYEIKKDEVSIGRGDGCDVILNDKKSSRKNSVIRRSGSTFTIVDLNSGNGTYVNGSKVKECVLSGDDEIMVGDVKFMFKARSGDYEKREKDFLTPPVEEEMPQDGFGLMADGSGNEMQLAGGSVPDDTTPQENGEIPGIPGIPGLQNVPGTDGGKKDLLAKFKALPRRSQVIWATAIIIFIIWVLDEDQPEVVPPPRKPASVVKVDKEAMTFERLSPDQKAFVKSQRDLAFGYYQNKDYDRCIYEMNKIFDIIPDYENAREIKRYALEGKQRLAVLEEERNRKEEEAKLKKKIAVLVDEATALMEKRQYEQAKEVFSNLLGIDPDNSFVPVWRKEIERYEEEVRFKEQQTRVQREINKEAAEVFKQGIVLKKQGKYYSAIATFGKIKDMGASDKPLIRKAQNLITQIYAIIRNRRDPLLAEAKRLEEGGEFPEAFKLYRRAIKIDPRHSEGYAGINRIKSVLHERAKTLYTEAVLAESYSDFDNAIKLFQSCIDTAPSDDIYHERGKRKLSKYYNRNKEGQSGSSSPVQVQDSHQGQSPGDVQSDQPPQGEPLQ